MNLGEMKERLFRLLGESATNPQFFDEDQADRYLNDAYLLMARDTGNLEIRQGIAAVEGQWEYTLPPTVGPIMRVSYDDYELRPEMAHRMDQLNYRWQTETGTPERWIKSREGYDSLKVWRAPDVSGPSGEASIEYGIPTDIEGDGGIEFEFTSEVGSVQFMSGDGISFKTNQEFGRVTEISFSGSNLEVWAKKVPEPLDRDEDEPELLPVLHMGIVFRAAEAVLGLEREGRNEDLAKVYGMLADEYVEFGVHLVSRRMPERTESPRTDVYDARVTNFYRETRIPATGLPGAS